jgi:hypothetical protein
MLDSIRTGPIFSLRSRARGLAALIHRHQAMSSKNTAQSYEHMSLRSTTSSTSTTGHSKSPREWCAAFTKKSDAEEGSAATVR